MGRARKVHEQQQLPLPEPKGTWGGKREGAGRPPIKDRHASEHHKRRPAVRPSEPIHVICRVARGVGSLRKKYIFEALREATYAVIKHEDFRIVQLSVQGTHLHLLVEAQNRTALSRGMKAFLGSAAKQFKRVLRERGQIHKGAVFTDRFHMRILRTPREVHHALNYVLNNWRHHDEDRAPFAAHWQVDPYSSAWSFFGWKERKPIESYRELPPGYEPLLTWLPKSWLLRVGWRRTQCASCAGMTDQSVMLDQFWCYRCCGMHSSSAARSLASTRTAS